MKKLFLLLILSFFSAQSFAGSCPDGSEPVKSVSDDGTYFVYNCGGQASSSSDTNSNSNQAYESFPVHEFAKSPLRDLKVPENWQLFKDPEELYRFHDQFKLPVHEKHLTKAWKMQSYVNDCERAISEWDQSWLSYGIQTRFIRCATVYTHQHFRNPDEGIRVFERILLSWAKNKPVAYPASKNLTTSEWGDLSYAATMLVGDFASFYAVYYDDFDFTLEQRQAVDSYLSDWLINHDIDPPRTRVYQRCVLEEPERFEIQGNNWIYMDYCGSNRWRMGLGAVYLGLRTGNQELFTAGNRHIEINLASIDKDGIYPQWARKGALALSYQRQLPEVLTLLAVAYESIGYDFYEHQLPHGKKIHEVYAALFDFIYHPEKLNKYAFAAWDFVGEDAYEFDKLPLEEKWRIEMIYPEVLVSQSKGYVLRYRPDLLDKIDYSQTWGNHWKDHISLFVNISGIAIYESFNQNVSKLIQKQQEELEKKQEELEKKQEEKKQELEEELTACKVSELNGEYIASWYLVDGQDTKNLNDNNEPDFQGSETLILDKCVGEFEGVESFQPSKELRKNLQVSFKPDGQITISGNLDLWEVGYSYPTVLKGDLNSGEISDFWWNGKDLIKIEIIKIEPEPEINWDEDKLKGEYAAKWYIGNAMDNPVTFEYRGKDALILERGKGVFSGVFSGMGYRFPSRDERGKLKIDYKPNGEITVEGDLGIFHNNKSYPTLLEGDINSGLISGVWEEGDLIKIEITKTGN